MSQDWERHVQRWVAAGIVDPATADRIREYEKGTDDQKLRWPVLLAVLFGALLAGAGVLLFVAAHWDDISPAGRFGLVVAMIAIFHGAAAFTIQRFPVLGVTLHALGSIALGAGIFLSGQIFHLETHWTNGVLLWTAGVGASWWILDSWPQGALFLILLPTYLWGYFGRDLQSGDWRYLHIGFLLLALAYFTGVRQPSAPSTLSRAAMWIGGIALVPMLIILGGTGFGGSRDPRNLPAPMIVILMVALPYAASVFLRRDWLLFVPAVAWGCIFLAVPPFYDHDLLWGSIWHLWMAVGGTALAFWGVYEGRTERINMGIALFAGTVLSFYFSNVMDKLGRSISLIGLGVLLLASGWALERFRRQLVARLAPA